MLRLARDLLDRLRQPRSRALELRDLRRRLAAEAGPRRAGAEERALAVRLREQRGELSSRLAGVTTCRRCAVGRPPPHGRWDGGFCCGAATEVIFTDEELGALKLAGTRAGHLRAPAGPHAGCAFRGPTGCVLPAAHRAAKCLRYLCPALARELHARGELDAIEALAEELHATYERFVRVRAARLDDEAVGLSPARAGGARPHSTW
jgi:hypothetical protein